MKKQMSESVRSSLRRSQEKFDSISSSYEQGQAGRLDLEQVLTFLHPSSEDVVLDVATGTGVIARALVPSVQAVVGVDISSGMMDVARAALDQEGTTNAILLQADAGRLPVSGGGFDIVVCSRALHHMERPLRALEEMFRAACPGARLLLIDSVSYEDRERANLHNELERLRDPSHVRSLALPELQETVRLAGFSVERMALEQSWRPVDVWLEDAGAGAAQIEAVKCWIADKSKDPGFRLEHFTDAPDGSATFRYRLAWILGRKEC
jgi:ubiquinone/menaquinone biosynthesis C-methylase UbiE